MAVAQVAGVPHQAVVVRGGEQRRDQIAGLPGQELDRSQAQREERVSHARDRARLSPSVLEVDLDLAADLTVAHLVWTELETEPSQTRMDRQAFVVGRIL